VVTVRAAKPKAIVFADAAEVEIVRTSRDYPGSTAKESASGNPPSHALDPPFATSPLGLISAPPFLFQGQHLVAIALGSNLGDRFGNIEAALRLLECEASRLARDKTGMVPNLAIVNTSFLYETAPMYVTDQPSFLNCACIVRLFSLIRGTGSQFCGLSSQAITIVAPLTLLELIKKIERTLGRVPSIRNGPRAVDLDILFYDDAIIDTRPESLRGTLEGLEGHLVVPHPRMAEREFVLRPLQESAYCTLPVYPTCSNCS
jgi:dihydroneopterin aldolase / 2-amino-4-hydroxy-6-hydroxymethyldihydropteridine diphosphokinase / dihydropteroate synthase